MLVQSVVIVTALHCIILRVKQSVKKKKKLTKKTKEAEVSSMYCNHIILINSSIWLINT